MRPPTVVLIVTAFVAQALNAQSTLTIDELLDRIDGYLLPHFRSFGTSARVVPQ